MRVQYDVLASILRRNRDTTFGRQHGFAAISGYPDFIERVQISDFEALRPFVEAEIDRGEPALTAEAPVRYVRTSGTTGSPKNVPLTKSHLESLRRIHRISVAFQHRTCPDAFAGSILAIVSPAFEGTLPNGKPFGSASGIVAGDTPALVLEKFVIPRAVLTVADSRLKYLLILRLALLRRDISYTGAANSTTLLTIMKLHRTHAAVLIDDVTNGTFFLANEVPPDVWSVVRSRLRPDPERAAELAGMQAGGGVPRIADLWPTLRLIVTWTCSSAGVTLDALRRELSPRTRILELGYLSSEFRGTITLGRRADFGLPTFDTHFFEFVEREDWDAGKPRFLTLDCIRKGVDYYIIVTTPSGLFRYFINDLVRVTGRLHDTPLLRFLQKGKGVTNITGEKLYEAQVLEAVRSAMSEFGQAARFVMMQADEAAQRYHLYVEPNPGLRPEAAELGRCIDAKLCAQNIEYQAKRESARLDPPVAKWLAPDTGEAYKQFCIAKGQREGQFKTIALAYRTSDDFRFDDHTESA